PAEPRYPRVPDEGTRVIKARPPIHRWSLATCPGRRALPCLPEKTATTRDGLTADRPGLRVRSRHGNRRSFSSRRPTRRFSEMTIRRPTRTLASTPDRQAALEKAEAYALSLSGETAD